MKTGLLLSAARVAVGVAVGGMVVGAADVRAACTTTPNCESMGYKYCASECPSGSVACPFDSSKRFCFSPKPYSVAASTCSSQCKNAGSQSCTRGGVTYYESCGTSMCSSSQTCENGSCVSPVAKDGYCCGYSGCNANETWCQNNYSKNCYRVCTENYGWPDCGDMQARCRATGGTPAFMDCVAYTFNGISVPRGITASFVCH